MLNFNAHTPQKRVVDDVHAKMINTAEETLAIK